jgi:hypothetical protein
MTENQSLPPKKIAFIIDGEVVDILHTDDRLSAIFLSQPLALDITDDLLENPYYVVPGATYDYETKIFVNPETFIPIQEATE